MDTEKEKKKKRTQKKRKAPQVEKLAVEAKSASAILAAEGEEAEQRVKKERAARREAEVPRGCCRGTPGREKSAQSSC